MNDPLVSIIVPVYNAAPNLARCIESIRGQSYQNLEIIVVNDGSDDASMHIVNMYARVDKRIVAVDKENRGVSATRNLGMKLAGGEFLQFADSDDTLTPDSTRLLVDQQRATGADLVIGHYRHVDGKREEVYGFLDGEAAISKQDFVLQLMDQPASYYFGVMWNKLYRASIIRQYDLQCDEEVAWSEDFLFNLGFIRWAESFAAVKQPVYNYVYNKNSVLHARPQPIKHLRQKAELFAYYKELFEEMGIYEQYKLKIHKYLVSFAEHY